MVYCGLAVPCFTKKNIAAVAIVIFFNLIAFICFWPSCDSDWLLVYSRSYTFLFLQEIFIQSGSLGLSKKEHCCHFCFNTLDFWSFDFIRLWPTMLVSSYCLFFFYILLPWKLIVADFYIVWLSRSLQFLCSHSSNELSYGLSQIIVASVLI